jgi:hypothetical protein
MFRIPCGSSICAQFIALQQLHSVRQGSKAFANNFPHTWLWLIQLAARLRSWLPSPSPISPQNTISYFHSGNRSALHKQPVPTRFKPVSDRIRGRSYIQFILKINFYKFWILNGICKDNTARNWIAVQHKCPVFPSNSTRLAFILRESA